MANNVYKFAIARAFMKLTEQKAVSDIKVNDIIKECGISRPTFYNYFTDKYSIIEYLYDQAIGYMKEIVYNEEYDIETALVMSFRECQGNKRYYTSIASYEGQNSFESHYLNSTRDFYEQIIIKRAGAAALTDSIRFAIEFACHGTAFMFTNWIKTGMNESPEFMAERICACIPKELYDMISA